MPSTADSAATVDMRRRRSRRRSSGSKRQFDRPKVNRFSLRRSNGRKSLGRTTRRRSGGGKDSRLTLTHDIWKNLNDDMWKMVTESLIRSLREELRSIEDSPKLLTFERWQVLCRDLSVALSLNKDSRQDTEDLSNSIFYILNRNWPEATTNNASKPANMTWTTYYFQFFCSKEFGELLKKTDSESQAKAPGIRRQRAFYK